MVANGDEDLLGGSDTYGGMESGGIDGTTEFESSFPSIDTRNEVCLLLLLNRRKS